MNKRCRVITKEEYEKIVNAIQYGYTFEGVRTRPNPRLAVLCICQANMGLRIGDCLKLTLNSIKNEGGRYHLQIVEEKTKKPRTFIVDPSIYTFLQTYALEMGIKPNQKLFPISQRAVSKQYNRVGRYMGFEDFGSHSLRKYFSMDLYNLSNYNIELVRTALQHSSVAITQKYISVSPKLVEDTLLKHSYIPTTANIA